MKKLTGKKLVLLLLYAPDNKGVVNAPIAGRTRFMKMGFLFEKELLVDFQKDSAFDEVALPDYFAWNFGPFSTDFLNDLEFLVNQLYVTVNRGTQALPAELSEYAYWVDDTDEFYTREYEEEIFELTQEKGLSRAADMWSGLTEGQQKLLTEFKRVLNRAPLDRILEYVYRKYHKEGYVEKSLIRQKYLKDGYMDKTFVRERYLA